MQVIFRKRATNYRALLQNMTYEDKASHDSTPPCSDMYLLFVRVGMWSRVRWYVEWSCSTMHLVTVRECVFVRVGMWSRVIYHVYRMKL